MPIILIPLIPFICCMILLGLNTETTNKLFKGSLSIFSSVISIFILIWLVLHSDLTTPEEYLFSLFFKLPGTSESLSFSLLVDSLSVIWLSILFVFSPIVIVLELSKTQNISRQTQNLATMQLAQSGLATLYLSGSLVTSLVGWAIALASIILSTAGQSEEKKNKGMSFMILMLSVFFLIASIFLIFGISGKLSYANNPYQLKTFLENMVAGQSGNIVQNILNLSGFCLILGILPGLGLAPFTSWLEISRESNPVSALYIYTVIIPAGTILLQRYIWFFALTPILRYLICAISIVSLIFAWLACYSQQGGKLTMPWLAVSGTALLALAFTTLSVNTTIYTLITIYPGFLIFGTGRILSIEHGKSIGRIIQKSGLLTIILTSLILTFLAPSETGIDRWFLPLLIPGFLIPAIFIYRYSASSTEDTVSFPSALGWTAFSFFGMSTFLKYFIAWPIQQIADGFWTIETYYNQFWQFGIGRIIRGWSKLLWLFDSWFVNGATRWLTSESKHLEASVDGKE